MAHGAMSTGSPRRKPANMNSLMPGGSGAVAAYVTAGSVPRATATSILSPASRKLAAPSWWMWMCMPVVWPSKTWRRYMPAFWRPCWSLVTTIGSVMNGPPSPGHVVSTGRRVRSGGSTTTSRNRAFLPYLGP